MCQSLSIVKVCAMEAFIFAIQRLFATPFRLAESSSTVLPPVSIAISNSMAASCLKYSKVSLELSSMPARLCNAKLAIGSLSCMDEPGTFSIANPLCTSSIASRIHSFFQKLSPKIMHILCRTKHVLIKSGTFFKCTSTLFNKIRHLHLSIPNARSIHMRVELWR